MIDLWTYSFPLSAADEARLAGELRTIPPLLRQARQNLTGNARELWLTGIGTMQGQVAILEDLQKRNSGAGKALAGAIADALQATRDFVGWLEEQAPSKTGPPGIGKDNYNWLLRNVYLIPMTWDDEVRLLRRELDRAHSSLHLEEQRNRNLPSLVAAATPEEYARKADEGATKYLAFLAQNQVMPIRPYMDPALRAHLGSFVPIGALDPHVPLVGPRPHEGGPEPQPDPPQYQIERLLTERSHQLGDAFKLADFFAEVDAAGVIPVSLIRWQLTGRDDEIRALLAGD